MSTSGSCLSCGRDAGLDEAFCPRCSGYPRLPRTGVENAATHLNDLLLAAWSDGRHPIELFDPGFVRDDRRSIVGMGTHEASDYHDVMQQVFELGGRPVKNSPLAVRGERFSLTRGAIRYDDGRSVSEYLVVQVLDASHERVLRFILFDPDDFEAAYAELDAQWLGSLPDDEAAARRDRLSGQPR